MSCSRGDRRTRRASPAPQPLPPSAVARYSATSSVTWASVPSAGIATSVSYAGLVDQRQPFGALLGDQAGGVAQAGGHRAALVDE